ncbi:hypothetical protein FDP41_006708 [Naegleria fowleri]|uniref:Uncharacterized protein n=1 Tax=Naegleria fowleri TaxID=5763 RepID=A0A6A5BJ60_NAEFO|nr:uncharacterized protein FDP41_006708 [Naegleria fowleri]KAF0974098.1 hypothetical protein FDP41_006708 [Naegleria fowleri]
MKTTTQYVGYPTRNYHETDIHSSSSSNKFNFNDDAWMDMMKKVVPNNQHVFNTRTFGQIRSFTTSNWLKKKEASTNVEDSRPPPNNILSVSMITRVGTLHNIVENIKMKGIYYATDELRSTYNNLNSLTLVKLLYSG